MPSYLSNLKINQVSQAGSVVPMSFVTNDPNQDYTCRQATGGSGVDLPLGVAQVGGTIVPGLLTPAGSYPGGGGILPAGSSVPPIYAGGPGDQIQIFSTGDVAPVRIGQSATSPSLPVKNGTWATCEFGTGLAVPIAAFTASSYRGGVFLRAGNPGEIVEIFVLPGRV